MGHPVVIRQSAFTSTLVNYGTGCVVVVVV